MLAFVNTISMLLSHVPPSLIPFLLLGLVFIAWVVIMDKVLTWVERRYLKKGNANEKNS